MFIVWALGPLLLTVCNLRYGNGRRVGLSPLISRADARHNQGARVCRFRAGDPKNGKDWDMILCFVSLPNTAVVPPLLAMPAP